MPTWLIAAMRALALGLTHPGSAGDGGVSVFDKMAMSMVKAIITWRECFRVQNTGAIRTMLKEQLIRHTVGGS